jgi:hypothetical protein
MNDFERHGIDHLSPSSLNLWAAEPALWVMERLLGRRSPISEVDRLGTPLLESRIRNHTPPAGRTSLLQVTVTPNGIANCCARVGRWKYTPSASCRVRPRRA